MDIAGRVALVTGGAAGIGRATAMALASAGARVMVADIDDIGGTATVRTIEETLRATARFVKVDAGDPVDVRLMFEAVDSTFGGVDIVHLGALPVHGERAWPDQSLERMAHAVAVGLGGVAMGTQEAIKALRRRGGGVIVNATGVAALTPSPDDPLSSATGAAVVRLVESCTAHAVEGIRVNGVVAGPAGDGPSGDLAGEAAEAVLDLVRDDGAVGEVRVVGRTPGT